MDADRTNYVLLSVVFLILAFFVAKAGFVAAIRFIRMPIDNDIRRWSNAIGLSLTMFLASAFLGNIVNRASVRYVQWGILLLATIMLIYSLYQVYRVIAHPK